MKKNNAKKKPGGSVPAKSKGAPANSPAHHARQAHSVPFPIVGIGASAGGLEALTRLLKHLPMDTGMGLVIVQHLDPKHASALTEILSRETPLPVAEVQDGMKVQPDCVYVIPPNKEMAILHGTLTLLPRAETQAPYMPIDYFLRSLAEDRQERAIGVILSGNASDGTAGLKAIKAGGGITFSQDEKSAKYSGMPHNAIASGFVDCVLPPEGIAGELTRLGRHPYVSLPQEALAAQLPEADQDLNKIFVLLRTATGVDFTYYKPTMIKRRILRRMVLHKLDRLENYVRQLQRQPAEIEALFQDLLIHVTGFFREAEVFDALRRKVFPRLLKDREVRSPIRVWVPGCSTGEEAYSLAICLHEFLRDRSADFPIQIFATDVSESSIEKARTGVYPDNITAEVSLERLRRFFVKHEDGYQVSKAIRDVCVFARQNVIKDPPFSRLDLVSCRNLLIYLGQVVQRKLLPIFHYSLNPEGFLILGRSETIGGFADLFTPLNYKHKIYLKKGVQTPPRFELAKGPGPVEAPAPPANRQAAEKEAKPASHRLLGAGLTVELDIHKEVDRLLLEKFCPSGVIIEDDLHVVEFRGRTGPYLEPPQGAASFHLLKMARPGLQGQLRAAVEQALKTLAPARRPGIRFDFDGMTMRVNLEVVPLAVRPGKNRYLLVLFEPIAPQKPDSPAPAKSEPKDRKARKEQGQDIEFLRHELAASREYMESIIGEQEATNEELQSANEEIQSSNEELQSTNEELETAKEELQSSNEELTTVNEELSNSNTELTQLNNDLVNLLASVNIPIVMLGHDLRIHRFTPKAEKVLNLIPTDVGRPISDLKTNINLPNLELLIRQCIDSLTLTEMEVQDSDGRWYLLRIRPYKTIENKIEGAVMALLDIDALKTSMEKTQVARAYAEHIIETSREPLLVLDTKLRVKSANRAFLEAFNLKPDKVEGRQVYDLGDGFWDSDGLRLLLEKELAKNHAISDFKFEMKLPGTGRKRLLLNARKVKSEDDTELILLAMQVTNSEGDGEGAV